MVKTDRKWLWLLWLLWLLLAGRPNPVYAGRESRAAW